jgi:DNA uptake protein ComE-like DNA-binding protein
LLFIDQVSVENDGMFRRGWIKIGILVLALGLSHVAGSARAAEPVDLNRATVTELMQVPGMTAVWAARIVRFRPYRSKLDLLDQGVVTPEVYQRIRDGVVAHRPAKGK